MREAPSPNHDARPPGGAVDILLVHYTGMPTAEAARARLTDAAAKVSAHYMIDEDGTVFRLVDEARREEVARMLSGRRITDEARAAADRLLEGERV